MAYQYMLDSEITILQMKNGELFLYYQHIMVQSISYMLVVYIHGYGFTTVSQQVEIMRKQAWIWWSYDLFLQLNPHSPAHMYCDKPVSIFYVPMMDVMMCICTTVAGRFHHGSRQQKSPILCVMLDWVFMMCFSLSR